MPNGSFEVVYRFDKGHKRKSHRFIYYYHKPYRKASKDTSLKWVKKMLKGAVIDMKIFSRHSTRKKCTFTYWFNSEDRRVERHEVICETLWQTNRRKQICRSNITIWKCWYFIIVIRVDLNSISEYYNANEIISSCWHFKHFRLSLFGIW